MGLDGLIRILAGIIIGELHGRNGIAALIARNSQEIVDHITLHSIGGESGLICYLGIILVEILREIHYWLLKQLEVSDTSHNHTERNRFACLDFLLVKTSRDIELTYSTREIGWTLRQRIYLQVIPGALMSFFTSTYPDPPLKKASIGSTLRFCCTTMPLKVMEGISSLPVI